MSPDPAGLRVLVMGLGRFGGGAGAARFLASRGAEVTVTDLCSEEELAPTLASLADLSLARVLGEHRPADFDAAELIVANPAIRPDHPLLVRARERGTPITSATELFLEATRAQVVGITGTQGKSSTCHFLARLLEAGARRVHLGGNIGGSLLDSIDAIGPADVCVLELSSYQLEALGHGGVSQGRLAAAGISNVLVDHLERHGTPAAYLAAKLRILELLAPGGVSALPANDPRWPEARAGERRLHTWTTAPPDPGPDDLFVAGTCFRLGELELGCPEELSAPGDFQVENALLAIGIASALGVEAATLARSISSLDGLPHRMQDLGMHRGVRIIDNGVSTTPDSTIAALKSLSRVGVLLMGGQAKALPLDELRVEIAAKVDTLILFGDLAPVWRKTLGGRHQTLCCADVREATREGLACAKAGDTLCFSPAAASFDAHANFRERAEVFLESLAVH